MTNQNASDAFDKLDNDKREAYKQEVKQEAIQEAKNALVSSLTDDKEKFSWESRGKKQPDNYSEMFAESDRRADAKIEAYKKEVENSRVAEQEARTKREEDKRQQDLKSMEDRRKSFDSDWYSLMEQGKMPKMADDIKEMVNKGQKLTQEQIDNDEGLVARKKLMNTVQQSGKSTKVAFYEDYEKLPAGAKAPVLGGRPSTPASKKSKDDYTYDEIKAKRREMFGF